MSPEQTIIVAESCQDYEKCGEIKYPAKYLMQHKSCKNCAKWSVGRCEMAQEILNAID
ncbi:MAG TPA: hypothetical protein GX534_05215 [Thermoanaerobacterales bacterium]|nr:hypothetical protein [Thermoanaerobacterales bacterium]